MLNGDGCSSADEKQARIDEAEDLAQLKSRVATMLASRNTFLDVMNNYAQDTQDVAWLEIEESVARELSNNNTDVSMLKNDVDRQAKIYYRTKYSNIVNKWNNYATGLASMAEVNRSLSGDYIRYTEWDIPNCDLAEDNIQIVGTREMTEYHYFTDDRITDPIGLKLQCVKGGNTTVIYHPFVPGRSGDTDDYVEGVRAPPWEADNPWIEQALINPGAIWLGTNDQLTAHRQRIRSQISDRWHNSVQNFRDEQAEVENEGYLWVESVVPAYENGSIRATELLSRTNKMNNYAADADGSFNDAVAAAASAGLSVPTNQTGYMTIQFEPMSQQNATLTKRGLLLSSTAPNGSWDTGVQYNSTDISGGQMVSTLNGSEYVIDGDFTILEAYRENGTVYNGTISAPSRDYKVTNSSETQELIEQLGERVSELEEMQNDPSGTGPVVPQSLIGQIAGFAGKAALYLGALVAAMLLLGFLAVVS
jgi:hypothetical protein